jgi:hypothetical protein
MSGGRPKKTKPQANLDLQEIVTCSPGMGYQGFLRFCVCHTKIKCKRTNRAIPFDLYPAQRDLGRLLCSGESLIVLKCRQLGITWLVAAYIVWKAFYTRFFTALAINQNLQYAEDFLGDKCKFIYLNLPPVFQHVISAENKTYLRFGGGADPHGSEIRALAGNERTARSLTGSLTLFDEASRIDGFQECLQAAMPAIESTGGQCVVVSTSAGPVGAFYALWKQASSKGYTEEHTECAVTRVYRGPGRFVGVFFPFDAHPDRNDAWYERQAGENLHDPLYMPREYPRTPDEAFQHAGGRVFPFFRPYDRVQGGHALLMDVRNLPPRSVRYRAIDWGESHSAFVCLWILHVPSPKPCFSYDPDLDPNFVREMLEYSWKEDGQPLKVNDHCPDALRMAVATFDLEGWVHVYRCWYVAEAASKGHTSQTLCAGVRERSGWQLMNASTNYWKPLEWAEEYRGTCYDRSHPMLENELARFDIDGEPHSTPGALPCPRNEEVREGIGMVNKLIVGALPNKSLSDLTPAQIDKQAKTAVEVFAKIGIDNSVNLHQRILKNQRRRVQRAYLRRRRRRI